MNATPGSIISSANPGDIAGSAPAPAGTDNIMKSMFSEMVSPEDIPANGTHVPNGAPSPVTLKEPVKQPVAIEPSKKEADLSLFEPEVVEEVKEAKELQIDDEPDMSDIPDEPAKEHWKKAREALKTERKTVKTLQKEFESTKAKLEKYEKGEVVPEIIAAKDLKIQEYEKYATIVNGRLSDEYQTLVTQPLTQKTQALNKIAEDYQVPENIRGPLIQKIVETENEKDRNQLITKYFPDAIGATKVEGLVRELHGLGQVALDMEKKPAEVMQTLQTQYQAKKEIEAATIASEFESVSKVAWTKALEKTAGEGLFPELILDPTNAEHSKIAEKNQHRAAIQFGAAMKMLHANGLKTAPEPLVTGLARAIQLSIGAVGVAKQLQAAQARIAELEGNNGMIAAYFRPGMNSNGGGRAPVINSNDRGPASPQEAGKAALKVFG